MYLSSIFQASLHLQEKMELGPIEICSCLFLLGLIVSATNAYDGKYICVVIIIFFLQNQSA